MSKKNSVKKPSRFSQTTTFLVSLPVLAAPFVPMFVSTLNWQIVLIASFSLVIVICSANIDDKSQTYREKELSEAPLRKFPSDVVYLKKDSHKRLYDIGLGTLAASSDRLTFKNETHEIVIFFNEITKTHKSSSDVISITSLSDGQKLVRDFKFDKSIELFSWEKLLKQRSKKYTEAALRDLLSITFFFGSISVFAQFIYIIWSFIQS